MLAFRRMVGIALSSVVMACTLLAPARAGDLDATFSRNDPKATMTVDHSAWDRILKAYVVPSPDGVNRFAYGRVSARDREALKSYLAMLQSVKVTALNAAEQRATWINFYNALTIEVVLDHYPVKSIRDIGGGLFTIGPWKKELVTVEGRKLSLDNIEHDILRKTWNDPRVHYAVNCASMSCPNLMAEAFTGANLEEMLNRGASDYVNHPRGVKVTKGRVRFSEIYSWYRKDFGADTAALLRHLSAYAGPELKKQLAGIESIEGYDYDWSLNEAK